MLKVNYTITAKQPLHTGSDESFGTERTLRREKVLLPNPVSFESNFTSEEERRKAIVHVLLNVWRNIDWDGIGGGRLMTIYDEFASKLLASTGVRTKEQFLNKICEKWRIRSLTEDKLIDIMDMFNDEELLECIRQEYQYLVLLLRRKTKDKSKGQLDMFHPVKSDDEKTSFEKHFDTVPFISGNSIRGLLRRLVMKDFCDLVGITKINKDMYHQLFTGGNITDSTGFEDIEKRENYVNMCPMIGLLGSAIGNMTIQGEMKVGGARLKCKENGTGEKSYWELIDLTFGTRLDSSKTEKGIEVDGATGEEKNQMKYEYEVFVRGSKFDSVFALITENNLLTSAFWRAMKVYKQYGYLVGNSARDSGLVDIDIEVPENADGLYLDYLKENESQIKEYFNVETANA